MEHDVFKQRIVGGLVLVALGAIVIPFLLDMRRDNPWWSRDNIPKKPDNGFVTRVLPLEAWSKEAQAELAQVQPAPAPALPAAESPVTTVAAKSSLTEAGRTPEPAPAAAESLPATPSEGWMVQLASFSSRSNAEELRRRLEDKGYPVVMEDLRQGGQAVYRVRVGPEAERAAAEQLRQRVEREFKLKALVLHVP